MAAAENFKWYYDSKPGVYYASAEAACPQSGPYGSDATYVFSGLWFDNSTTVATCMIQVTYNSGGGMSSMLGKVWRMGDSCPSGATYNEKTGACDPAENQQEDGDMCEDQQGHGVGNPMIFDKEQGKCIALVDADLPTTCKYFGGRGKTDYTVAGVLDTGGEAVAPPKFAGQMGCEVATVSSSECTINVKGDITCNVQAVFTGEVAGQTAGPDPRDKACDMVECTKKDPQVELSDKPCVMSGGACTSETETSKEGKQSCGEFNGNYICATSKPSSQGTKIETTEKSETQADGSVKTTKTDTATKTTCTDVKTCTSKTSTTTTTTTTSKTGQTTSTTSKCTGECGADGKGVGGSNGDGTGTGGGGEEGDGGIASASDDCTVPPRCDGDAYLCSILRQEYLDSCAERALPTDKDKADLKALIDKQQAEIDANQKVLDDKVTTLVSQFQSASSGAGTGGGQCFQDKTFTVPVTGASFTLPFSQACGVLEWFRYAVLAIAYLISLRLVTKEI
ncbi:virulence factor TspB C-terminal domain-related protein [Xanthomonas campestris]|uniref:virulence factor TspB C-terminal domain-related protein n=1 Tax=Xanthomonas campestris TaxID=339 RepID=UPI0011C06333|nr:virulence factor TspB C-terminal domain-related protein [Xanthomonas campestris]